MPPQNSNSNFRMGVLIPPPLVLNQFTNIRWNYPVLGVFFGPNPLPVHLVQGIVNSQWEKKNATYVHKIGCYHIFECFNHCNTPIILSFPKNTFQI